MLDASESRIPPTTLSSNEFVLVNSRGILRALRETSRLAYNIYAGTELLHSLKTKDCNFYQRARLHLVLSRCLAYVATACSSAVVGSMHKRKLGFPPPHWFFRGLTAYLPSIDTSHPIMQWTSIRPSFFGHI